MQCIVLEQKFQQNDKKAQLYHSNKSRKTIYFQMQYWNNLKVIQWREECFFIRKKFFFVGARYQGMAHSETGSLSAANRSQPQVSLHIP
jgi:hypothetical protein